jgi:hypothetical protein
MQAQMFGNRIHERRLRNATRSLRALREELRVSSEQLEHTRDDEHDKELRSLVSETPLAAREYEEAQRHRHVLETHVARLRQQIGEMESMQDHLLDRMNGRG